MSNLESLAKDELTRPGMFSKDSDYGSVFEKRTAAEACDKAALAECPLDEMYGPNNPYSTRRFVRGCLSATPL